MRAQLRRNPLNRFNHAVHQLRHGRQLLALKDLLRQQPWLLSAAGRAPRLVVDKMVKAFGQSTDNAGAMIQNQTMAAVLFENPSTFGYVQRITALREIVIPEGVNLKPEDLSLTKDWSRLYQPPGELQARLDMLRGRMLNVGHDDLIRALFLPTRDAFTEALPLSAA